MQLQTDARAAGVSEATIDQVFSNLEELPRVVASDKAQPEFRQTFTEYYGRRVTESRVTRGRELLKTHRSLLARLAQETGVPPHYLVAFWGLETNFGSYFGTLHIPSALATLACEGRRRAFFTNEFLATLKIVDSGDIAANKLIGSWAGAIGHMQFMPTTFLAHARDGDGDGKRDLLGSIDDALSSGAHYLQDLGWERGFRWGREVLLPENFDYINSGSHLWKPLEEWSELGVKTTAGQPVGTIDIQASLLLPTGHTGPAFLVYDNFKIIMNWNRSEFYALSVGRLADRIAGGGGLLTSLPKADSLKISIADVSWLQAKLNTLGYPTGKPDGIVGPATRKAIQAYQHKLALTADGYPTGALIDNLRKRPLE